MVEADDLQASETAPNEANERLIANRLDALEAERIMQRALELEAQSLDEPHMITTEQLENIAREIGVDTSFVHQALGESKLTPAERSWFARFVLPEDLVEQATIEGLTREQVDSGITKWMTQREGFTQGHVLPDGVDWDVDRRWRARTLSRSLAGSNRISRVAGGDVEHRVHSLSEHEHVVAMRSAGKGPLLLARLGVGISGALTAFLLLGAVINGDILIGLALCAGLFAAASAITIAGARWWAAGIRGALRRSLAGLVSRAKPSKSWLSRFRRKPGGANRPSGH